MQLTTERWQLAKTIVADALEEPATTLRSSLVSARCAGDELLRREVESLLAQETKGSFELCADEGATLRSTMPVLEPGQRLGAYAIVAEIGRGGMGAVYLAQRADGAFEKRVAIKVLKRGLDTDEILQRFLAERQILARLDHPGIVRMVDAGMTDDSLPYLVMDYVEGLPITQFVREQDLAVPKRLELFRAVCAAVSYAHQNLIVHRDLKPSNILITNEGQVRLLDFGIAKLLEAEAEGYPVTMVALRVMTPEYASPEQAAGGAVTTVSDVYSLGVVLYELLTGERPHAKAGGEEPGRPSTAITRKSAGVRHTSDLRRQLRGDLDNIVLKALRREPSRRYGSVDQLLADLRRHSENRPVLARPDTLSYRLTKFGQRNKLGLAAAAIVLLTLVGGIIGTSWKARQANDRFNQVRELAHAVLFDYHDAIASLPGSTAVRERLVKDSLKYLDNLSQQSSGNTSLQRELVAAYLKIGDVQGLPYSANLGDSAGALASYRRAQAMLEGLIASYPSDQETQSDLSATYARMAKIQLRTGEFDPALQMARRSVPIAEKLVALEPAKMQARDRLADCYLTLGKALYLGTRQFSLEDQQHALEAFQRALAINEKLRAEDPGNTTPQDNIAIDLTYIGYAYWKIGDITGDQENNRQALANFRQALTIFQNVAAAEPHNARWQRQILSTDTDIARSYLLLRDPARASEMLEAARLICESLIAIDADNFEVRQDLADIYRLSGDTLEQSGNLTASRNDRLHAVALYEKLLQSNPADMEARASLASVSQALAKLAGP